MTEESDEWAEILQDFLIESSEILENLPTDILSLEERPEDKEQLNKLFRSFHTIKGSAGFLGFGNLADFTHKLEDLLNKLRRFEIQVTPEIIDLILEATDAVKGVVETVRETKKDEADLAPLISRIEAASQGKAPAPSESTPKPDPQEAKPPSAESAKPDPKLGEILVEKNDLEPGQLEEALEAQEQKPRLGDVLVEKGMVSREKVDQAAATQKKKEPVVESTIRVDVDRLDSLLNLVGELVHSRNRLSQLQRMMFESDLPDSILTPLGETINQIAFNTSELQMGVMRTRMLPIARVFNKFQRLIRELERKTGKPIRLQISGEETELDKTIIEEIGDPLIHLIRNAVDHGIEPPDERIAEGKDPQGTVSLRASHQGNQIVIEIQDDGRGMNVDRIVDKALRNGVVSEDKLAQMSKPEILDLIFMPGFSTAENVSDISGRGVGMDVVKNKITQLKGLIELNSEAGKGSLVRLKLPLTLAIIQVLMVRVSSQIYAIPLTSVVESLRIRDAEVYSVDGQDVVEFRGRIVPLNDLHQVFQMPILPESEPQEKGEENSESGWKYIVIVGLGEKLRGMVVDRFVAQEEIVIKSLTRYLSDVKGFAGCTIMGDGKVSLILDIEHLMNN